MMHPLDIPESINESRDTYGGYVALLPGETFDNVIIFLNEHYWRTVNHLRDRGLEPVGVKQIICHSPKDLTYFEWSRGKLGTIGWKQQFKPRVL